MDYLIGMFVGIAFATFPRLIRFNNRKVFNVIVNEIDNMTINRCGSVKANIENDIKHAYLYGNINKKTHDKLINKVREKYNNLF